MIFRSAGSVAGSNFDLCRYVMSMPSASSVSSERSFLRRLTSETSKRVGIEARDHPREQPLHAVHARSFPSEVIADLQNADLIQAGSVTGASVARFSRQVHPTTRAGTPTAVARSGTDSRTTAPAPTTALAPISTPSSTFAPAPSHAPSPTVMPADLRACSSTGRDGVAEVVVAADEIAVRRNQRVAPDPHAARRENLAIEADVRAFGQIDIAVLARQNRVPADEDAARDADARVRLSLRVDEAVVVDDHVIADMNLVRMAQHDVLPEDDVAPAGAEQQRIQTSAQREPQRARHALRQQHDELVLEERTPAGFADDQRRVFCPGRDARPGELILDTRNLVHSHPRSLYHASVFRMPSRRPTCGA